MHTAYIKTLTVYFDAYYVQEITVAVAKEFRNWMTLNQGIKDRGMTLRMRCLSSFLTYCSEMQIIERNPLYGVNLKLPSSNTRHRIFSEDERKKIVSNASGDMLTFVLLCVECGLRHTEALSVRHDHIDYERKEIFIPDGKGGKSRVAFDDDVGSCTITYTRKTQIRRLYFHGAERRSPEKQENSMANVS